MYKKNKRTRMEKNQKYNKSNITRVGPDTDLLI